MSRERLGAGETKHLTVKLPEGLDRRLRARAMLAAVPVAQVVRNAIAAYLHEFEK